MRPIAAFKPKLYALRSTGPLRRTTLVSLRWLAVSGQLLSLVFVWQILRFDLPFWPCLSIIAISAVINFIIMSAAPLDRRVSQLEAAAQLLFDTVQLAVLLFLTGGLLNPFSLLLLAPVIVAATTLNVTVFLTVAAAASGLSLALMNFHWPLPWEGTAPALPPLYMAGQFMALLVGMTFTAAYSWRTTAQTRRMSRALAASEAILADEKKISALGGLAAAAAHELGTPLATIQTVARELTKGAAPGSDVHEDAELVLSQAERCRAILQELAGRGDFGDEIYDRLDLAALLREITEPFKGFGTTIETLIAPQSANDEIPIIERQPELVYGLTNIVENAVDFAERAVRVQAGWDAARISIEILDDGPGFRGGILARLGEPFISRRGEAHQRSGGMGLGVFIAKTLVERAGGDVSFANRRDRSGARVVLSWPRG